MDSKNHKYYYSTPNAGFPDEEISQIFPQLFPFVTLSLSNHSCYEQLPTSNHLCQPSLDAQ